MNAKEISSPKEVYSCPFFNVSEVRLQLENGHEFTYYLNDGRDYVVIIAEQDNKLLMVKQYRYPVKKVQLEFSAGGINKDEDSKDAAYRELLEETGYKACNLKYIGSIQQLVARSGTSGHVYVASQLEDTGTVHLDQTEIGLEHVWVPITEFKQMIRENKISDGTSLAVWTLYQSYL